MKKFIIPLVLLLALSACGGGGGSGSAVSSGGTVTIKGNILTGTHAKSMWYEKLFGKISRSAHALDPNDVAKVMVFYKDGGYFISEVTAEGNFSMQVDRGGPAGMVFVGAANNFLGYLTLGNGIDTLPLNFVADDVAEIDLGVLTSSGLIVEPSHNPIGDEIPLTPEEQTALAQCDDLFSAIVMNPDVDGNGMIDSLEGKTFSLELYYGIAAGHFGGNLIPQIYQPRRLEVYQVITLIETPTYPSIDSCPQTIYLTGPPGSPFPDPTPLDKYEVGGYCRHRLVAYSPDPMTGGQYSFEYPATTLNFNIPDQSLILSNIAVPIPTVTLNADSTVGTITWRYQLADGSGEIANPESIITELNVGLYDWASSPGGLYGSEYFSPATTAIDLSHLGIAWSDVAGVAFWVFDIFGNGYFIKWDNI
ncbi:MAG: hypothetical protein GTO12_05970 [Proteobacteria bacterium]|nr:hypothetical protein [Pseudomonadota bacterium]